MGSGRQRSRQIRTHAIHALQSKSTSLATAGARTLKQALKASILDRIDHLSRGQVYDYLIFNVIIAWEVVIASLNPRFKGVMPEMRRGTVYESYVQSDAYDKMTASCNRGSGSQAVKLTHTTFHCQESPGVNPLLRTLSCLHDLRWAERLMVDATVNFHHSY